MTPVFEWEPGVDGVEPPPSDLLAFWADAPAIDLAPVWHEVQAGMQAKGRARPPGPTSIFRDTVLGRAGRWGAVAAMIVVGAIVGVALLVSTSGTASASFLEEVEDLSAQAASALDDGDLSASEAATLEALAGNLLARLEAGDDLASLSVTELDAVIRTLIGVRADLTAMTIDAPEASEPALASLATVSTAVGDARTTQSGGGTLLPVVPSTTDSIVIDELVPLTFFPLTVLAGEGGSVEIRLVEDGLEIGPVTPAAGWSFTVEASRGDIVAVAFASAGATVHMSVHLSAELSGEAVAVRLVIEDTAEPEGGASEEAVAVGDEADEGTAEEEASEDGVTAAANDGTLETYMVRAAGAVVVRRSAAGLSVARVETEEGWSATVVEAEGDEVRVEFVNGEERLTFEAELEDGALEINIADGEAMEAAEDDDFTFTLPIDGELSRTFELIGGTITIDVTETSIEALTVEANEGWEVETERIAGRQARVALEDENGDRATLKAEVAGGRLKIKLALIEHEDDADESDEDANEDEDADEDDFTFTLPIDGELSRNFDLIGGTITIDVTESTIESLEVEANEGWEVETERIAGREARVVLEDENGDRATFKAEVAGGRLKIKLALIERGDDESRGRPDDLGNQGNGNNGPSSDDSDDEDNDETDDD